MFTRPIKLAVLGMSIAAGTLPVAASSYETDVHYRLNFTTGEGYIQNDNGAIGIRPADQLVVHIDFNNSTVKSEGLYIRGDVINNTAERFFFREDGFLGIGYLAPTTETNGEKLRVNGSIVADGNIAAKYQDVAEWVDAPEAYAPGTVVVAAERAAVISTRGADTAVIGVVSAQPGILLGDAAPGRIAVAQSGRVRIKVDASNGAIAVGDLLVTSSVPGRAARSVPISIGDVSIHRPGTIIGKALEPLKSGRGEILALVTLQ